MTPEERKAYDANVQAQRDRILAGLPAVSKLRKLTARFTTNGECGHVIAKGDEFFYHHDGRLNWRVCSSCYDILKRRQG